MCSFMKSMSQHLKTFSILSINILGIRNGRPHYFEYKLVKSSTALGSSVLIHSLFPSIGVWLQHCSSVDDPLYR